jgi:hypothetical protein
MFILVEVALFIRRSGVLTQSFLNTFRQQKLTTNNCHILWNLKIVQGFILLAQHIPLNATVKLPHSVLLKIAYFSNLCYSTQLQVALLFPYVSAVTHPQCCLAAKPIHSSTSTIPTLVGPPLTQRSTKSLWKFVFSYFKGKVSRRQHTKPTQAFFFP